MRISKSELKFLRSLSQKKVRDLERKFVVEGWRALKDALNSDFRISLVAMTHQYATDPDHQSFIGEIDARKIQRKELTEIEIGQVSETVHAQGVVAVVEQNNVSLDGALKRGPSLVVFADHIADPGNLGSIVRTCDWFGADALVLSEGCVDLYNDKVVRSTSGSIFHVPVVESADTGSVLLQFKSRGFRIIATAGEAKKSYVDAQYRDKNVLVLGSEANGVTKEAREIADVLVGIPRYGRAESLNVGVACGIMLSHLKNFKLR
ncbi:MAG TPA: RNA methyltransferase [Bacteroidota bacterium]